jgi:predicted metal-binding membrane protein
VQTTLLIVIVTLTVAAWLLTYSTYQQMGLLMQIGVPMSLGMVGWAGGVSFIAFTGMWMIMMIAMMLPSTYPTLLLHRTVYRKRNPAASSGTFLFALGYFLIWTVSGAFFYAGYVLIGTMRGHIPGSEATILRAAGGALILSGLYQCSSLKRACLRHCQNPLHFVMEHWHDGNLGSLRMGATHGIYCFGCCWGLMVILFVMGVMHLGWMAAVGALILTEKIVPSRRWIPKAIGVAFVLVGSVVALFPEMLSRLSAQVLL